MNSLKSILALSFIVFGTLPAFAQQTQNQETIISSDANQELQIVKNEKVEQFLELANLLRKFAGLNDRTEKDIENFFKNYAECKELRKQINGIETEPAESTLIYFVDLELKRIEALYAFIDENKNNSIEYLNAQINQWLEDNSTYLK
ncbi:MAG: hypothetical protein ACOYT8_06365 [Candidatus Dependentiae bacterium]